METETPNIIGQQCCVRLHGALDGDHFLFILFVFDRALSLSPANRSEILATDTWFCRKLKITEDEDIDGLFSSCALATLALLHNVLYSKP